MADSLRETGWAEHEREQRRAWLRLTARQRLDWLWEARAFSLRAEEARRRRAPAGREGTPRPPSSRG
jgi:hypothetical protein